MQNGGQCSTHGMKEEDITDESEPAASSTLSKSTRSSMRKLVKAIALLCSSYDVDFRKLVKEHELVVGNVLGGSVGFILAGSPCNVRRDRNNNHTMYNIFGSNDVNDLANVL